MKREYLAIVIVILLAYIAYMNWPRGKAIQDTQITVPQNNEQIGNLQQRAQQQTTVIIKPSDNVESAIREWNHD